MSDKRTYSEKLKDPRWQKKRLEVFNRDQFTCQCCGNTEMTLHVHHLKYSGEPWEAPLDVLVTLCESCHEWESANQKATDDHLKFALNGKRFLSNEVGVIANGFMELKPFHNNSVMASVISYMLSSDKIMEEMCERYFAFLSDCKDKGMLPF